MNFQMMKHNVYLNNMVLIKIKINSIEYNKNTINQINIINYMIIMILKEKGYIQYMLNYLK